MPLFAILGFFGLMTSQAAQDLPAAETEAAHEAETLSYDELYDERMTVPVHIDGQGPFRFIIDTGAERTVISRELAEQLMLDASNDVTLSSVFDVAIVPTVILPELDVGRRTLTDVQAPALHQRNLGAQGVLGIDALEDQHVVFDFERQEMQLRRARSSRSDGPGNNVIVVRARNRLGRLVIADARVDGTRVYAILDTGSAVSIGNGALRERLVSRGRMPRDQFFSITSVTGTTMDINYAIVDRLVVGDAYLEGLPIAFTDAELFRQLDLLDRPAILLGMNALRAFDRVSIDFARGRVQIEIGTPRSSSDLNYASNDPR